MATKKPVRKTNPRKPTRNVKAVTVSGRQSGLGSVFKKPIALISFIVLFGAIGVYLLATSGALSPDEVLLADQPDRGLIYQGKKVKTKGPCTGGFDVTTKQDVKKDGPNKRRCAHLDPGPRGVDVRERIKGVDKNLADLAAYDEKVKPAKSDDKSGYTQPPMDVAATISAANMNGISARDWPCTGTGVDGPRIQFIYVYSSTGTNRLSDLRSGFHAIARRMNAIYYDSGSESGNGHQIRFATGPADSGCWLKIAPLAVPYSHMDDWAALKADAQAAGLKDANRKYIMWIDRSVLSSSGAVIKCGQGEVRDDDTPGQTNVNNTSVTYAFIWKSCWNYAEPHEMMHMLGAVQHGAPYATANWHCRDENDIMCYADAKGVTTFQRCDRLIDLWRLDCKHDTYYRGNDPASGYLSNHWNTANSKFLYR